MSVSRVDSPWNLLKRPSRLAPALTEKEGVGDPSATKSPASTKISKSEEGALFRTLSILKSVSPILGVEPNDPARARYLVEQCIQDAKLIVELIAPNERAPWATSFAQQMAAEALASEEELAIAMRAQGEGRRPAGQTGIEMPKMDPVDRRQYWESIIAAAHGGEPGPRKAVIGKVDDELSMTLSIIKGVTGLYSLVNRPWRFWQETEVPPEKALAEMSMRLRDIGIQMAEPLMSEGLSEHSRSVARASSVGTAFTIGQFVYRQMAHQALAEFRLGKTDGERTAVIDGYRKADMADRIADETLRRIALAYAMVPEVNERIISASQNNAPSM